MENSKAQTQSSCPTVRIRRATPEDAAEIFFIISQAISVYCKNAGIKKEQLQAGKEGIAEIQSLIETSFFFVCEKESHIVGTLRLTFPLFSSLLKNFTLLTAQTDGIPHIPVCYLSRFNVHPDYHRQGIGETLLSFAENIAKEQKSPALCLHTAIQNHVLFSFYKKRGFRLLAECYDASYPRGILIKPIE